ncbi:NADPH:quinone reductase-like Zn-dependent oxidoreductase [Actinomadura pelletieri DSM 43383]|uniref:NADPH:quinone reductase-like Zn-dependent oxidoreductase n=2 Tax=Actinomadura pelletieri TaxID=111805 RepID=A0A495QY46_9ACTN|nr:NADPH:quinone reductase-like Zn-dependent oxidoreductase [Actinomadura pelletieri DSM 43383]
MRAVVQRSFGGPGVLEYTEIERPVPLPTEVLVQTRAIGVNPVDGFIRSGAFPMLGEPPFILGWDVAGIVVALEPGVTRFAVGDEVYGMPMFPRQAGGYAEYVAAPSRHFALRPTGLDDAEAAALPLVGLTAWQSLVDTGGLQDGQRVLVHAAGGGVGHVAVQIAKALGAHVTATASTAKTEFVRGLGADEIVDYRARDFAEVVDGMDIVLDTIGGDTAFRSIQTLRPGGLLVTVADRRNMELAARTEAAGRRFAGLAVEPDHAGLEALTRLVETGRLRVHVSHRIPLAEAAKAHALVDEGRTTGKVVLTP